MLLAGCSCVTADLAGDGVVAAGFAGDGVVAAGFFISTGVGARCSNLAPVAGAAPCGAGCGAPAAPLWTCW